MWLQDCRLCCLLPLLAGLDRHYDVRNRLWRAGTPQHTELARRNNRLQPSPGKQTHHHHQHYKHPKFCHIMEKLLQ